MPHERHTFGRPEPVPVNLFGCLGNGHMTLAPDAWQKLRTAMLTRANWAELPAAGKEAKTGRACFKVDAPTSMSSDAYIAAGREIMLEDMGIKATDVDCRDTTRDVKTAVHHVHFVVPLERLNTARMDTVLQTPRQQPMNGHALPTTIVTSRLKGNHRPVNAEELTQLRASILNPVNWQPHEHNEVMKMAYAHPIPKGLEAQKLFNAGADLLRGLGIKSVISDVLAGKAGARTQLFIIPTREFDRTKASMEEASWREVLRDPENWKPFTPTASLISMENEKLKAGTRYVACAVPAATSTEAERVLAGVEAIMKSAELECAGAIDLRAEPKSSPLVLKDFGIEESPNAHAGTMLFIAEESELNRARGTMLTAMLTPPPSKSGGPTR